MGSPAAVSRAGGSSSPTWPHRAGSLARPSVHGWSHEEKALSHNALELVPDRAYVLGDALAINGRVSWYPESWRGHAPVNCLLLLEDETALLVDTGLTAHADVITAQLRELLGARRLSLALTRPTEFDGMCNAAILCRRFDVATIHANQPPAYHIHFHPELDEEPLTADGPAWWTDRAATHARIPLADLDLAFGAEEGTSRVAALLSPLRVLATHWMYDREHRILFTSDAFGHEITAAPSGPAAVDDRTRTASPERIAEHLRIKFEWTAAPGADTQDIHDALASLFADHPVDAIVPYTGLVLRGPEAVEAAIAGVLGALGGVHV